jgi:uroporphyrinogen-III synthase
VRRIAAGQADAVLFTTGVQVEHLFRVAGEDGAERDVRDGLQRMLIASIGPTTNEALEEHELHADLTPSHPKMGILVKEAAEQWQPLLERKRAAHAR